MNVNTVEKKFSIILSPFSLPGIYFAKNIQHGHLQHEETIT